MEMNLEDLRRMLGLSENEAKPEPSDEKKYLDFNDLSKFFSSSAFYNLVAKAQFDHKDYFETVNFINNLTNLATSYVETFGHLKTASLKDLQEVLEKMILESNKGSNALCSRNFGDSARDLAKQMITNKICKDNKIDPETASEEDLEAIKGIAIDSICKRDCKYHAFNSTFEDSIKKNGINPNAKDNEMIEDVSTMTAILRKHGSTRSPLAEGDKKKVYYSGAAIDSYFYSLRSPEWFDYFVGDKIWTKRDFKSAQLSLIEECSQHGIEGEEKETLLRLMKKYWDLYSNKKQMLAIIPNKQSLYDNSTTSYLKTTPSFNLSLRLALKDKYDQSNEATTETIDVKDAIFVELPNAQKVMEKVAEIDNKKELGVQQ